MDKLSRELEGFESEEGMWAAEIEWDDSRPLFEVHAPGGGMSKDGFQDVSWLTVGLALVAAGALSLISNK